MSRGCNQGVQRFRKRKTVRGPVTIVSPNSGCITRGGITRSRPLGQRAGAHVRLLGAKTGRNHYIARMPSVARSNGACAPAHSRAADAGTPRGRLHQYGPAFMKSIADSMCKLHKEATCVPSTAVPSPRHCGRHAYHRPSISGIMRRVPCVKLRCSHGGLRDGHAAALPLVTAH